jgi:hypothetical protein
MNDGIESLTLVYAGDSGIRAILLDVLKKAAGREDCPLCEITYSPLGKRSAWKACQARLGLEVRERHRDDLPASWGIGEGELPCVVAHAAARTPIVLVRREEIMACRGSAESLERKIADAMARLSTDAGRPLLEATP